jgi:CheY-like chemotaxis protein/anti-sigma regulatory factor (Ser/Thr protein kinase)
MTSAKTILVVDDDPDVHHLLKALLASVTDHIDDAYDGLEGLTRVEERPYDLVLTDVRMPKMDGLELLRRVREVRPETRVVVMTAENTPANIIGSIREQAFSYFSKPFSPPALVEMVTNALTAPEWRDDIEVLSAKPDWIALRLRCKFETADRILQFLREMEMNLPAEDQENIATAFRELLLNAIEHGGKLDPDKKVNVSYVRTQRAIIYCVRDPGDGFSLSSLKHAAVANTDDAPFAHVEVRGQLGLRPGGFGIFMTKQLADELIYNEKGNEVMLVKYL